MLSFAEICEFLDQKQGSKFDRELVTELFQRMDRNSDGAISTEEFILAFIDAQNQLKLRIEELD